MSSILPTSGAGGANPLSAPAKLQPSPKEGTTFGNILEDQLEQVNNLHGQADDAVKELAAGNAENVHETVMSVVEADLSLRLIIEIRNRLIESYQEIMRMQI